MLFRSNRFIERRFKEWINGNEIIRKKFSTTTIIYYPENFTFIPLEFYDNQNPNIPGELVIGYQNDVFFMDNYLQNALGNIVFPVPSLLPETINSIFPGMQLLHPATILDNWLNKLPDRKENSLMFYFSKNSFSLLIYSKSKLLVSNSFVYQNSNDVVFYVISILKQIKLMPVNTSLYLTGEILPNREMYNSLKKFFNSIIFLSPEIHVDTEYFKEPLHRFIVLF